MGVQMEFDMAVDDEPMPPETWMLGQLELAGWFDDTEGMPAFMYRVGMMAAVRREREAIALCLLNYPEQWQPILDRAPLPLWGIEPFLWALLGTWHTRCS